MAQISTPDGISEQFGVDEKQNNNILSALQYRKLPPTVSLGTNSWGNFSDKHNTRAI